VNVEQVPADEKEGEILAKLSPKKPIPDSVISTNGLGNTENPSTVAYHPATSQATKYTDEMSSSKSLEDVPFSANVSKADVDGIRTFHLTDLADLLRAAESEPSPRLETYSFPSSWADVCKPSYSDSICILPSISIALLSEPRWLRLALGNVRSVSVGFVPGPRVGNLFRRANREMVWNLLFSPDGHLLLSTSPIKLSLWGTASGVELGKFESNEVKIPVFSPGGELLAVAAEKRVIIWDLRTGKALEVLEHESAVNSVIFSPDGKMLASVSNALSVWRPETGARAVAVKFGFYAPRVRIIAFSPDGQVLAMMSTASVTLYDAKLARMDVDLMPDLLSPIFIAFSPVGKTLAVASLRKITLCDISEGSWISIDCIGDFSRLLFSPDGIWLAFIVMNTLTSSIRLWNLAAKDYVHRAPDFLIPDVAVAMAFSPDSKVLAVGFQNGYIHLWDVSRNGSLLASFKAHHYSVNTLAFSPDGKLLASGSSDKSIAIWHAPH
jgi:WD40 repeat protein